ncbi:MAG: ISNCY family transposase [Thermodesulfovibrionales bacterium]|nr:ISNCY family transposase [Thermodesulfovibrionales bacterium]
MRFEEAYEGWNRGRLTQEEAARLLGVCDRTFRRYLIRYEDEGMEGLADRRLGQVSHRCAPVDEVVNLADLYNHRYRGFTVKHFYSWYRRAHSGMRSYTWVKKTLQAKGLVQKAPRKGQHRKQRPRAPYVGMMLHQDGSRHEWVPGKLWDMIVTMDDASNKHYSMFFVEEEGTQSSFQGINDVIKEYGVFASLYTDRGSHYWHTPEAGGKVDKGNLTQFGRAMRQLGIEMIPAYSPEARGRSERAFRTHQERLVKELAVAGITDMKKANAYIRNIYLPAFNDEFSVPPEEAASMFVSWAGTTVEDILCEHYERTVGNDNCVKFDGLALQIPQDQYRYHYVRVKVRVHRYPNGNLAIFHGHRKLASYNSKGKEVVISDKKAA